MLPPRSNGWFLRAGLHSDLRDWPGKPDWKWSSHGEVVQTSVSVPEREYEHRRRQLAGKPHEHITHHR